MTHFFMRIFLFTTIFQLTTLMSSQVPVAEQVNSNYIQVDNAKIEALIVANEKINNDNHYTQLTANELKLQNKLYAKRIQTEESEHNTRLAIEVSVQKARLEWERANYFILNPQVERKLCEIEAEKVRIEQLRLTNDNERKIRVQFERDSSELRLADTRRRDKQQNVQLVGAVLAGTGVALFYTATFI